MVQSKGVLGRSWICSALSRNIYKISCQRSWLSRSSYNTLVGPQASSPKTRSAFFVTGAGFFSSSHWTICFFAYSRAHRVPSRFKICTASCKRSSNSRTDCQQALTLDFRSATLYSEHHAKASEQVGSPTVGQRELSILCICTKTCVSTNDC